MGLSLDCVELGYDSIKGGERNMFRGGGVLRKCTAFRRTRLINRPKRFSGFFIVWWVIAVMPNGGATNGFVFRLFRARLR